MEQVFRFWGYSPKECQSALGIGGPIGLAKAHRPASRYGRIELGPELAERCRSVVRPHGPQWYTWLVLDEDHCAVGRPLAWFTSSDRRRRPIIMRTDSHAFQFGFDVDQTIRWIQNEHYLPRLTPSYVQMGINPDALPPWVRRIALYGLSRIRHAIWRRRGFPAFPIDPAVDAWRHLIRNIVLEHTGASGLPLWPDGKTYALTISHDIDTDHCFRRQAPLNAIREIERRAGIRSAWMVVTKLLDAGLSVLDELHVEGNEIGFHGTHHDHRLAFLPEDRMAERIRGIRPLIDRYGASGFRSPCFLRTDALYRALDGAVSYDMSMHDAAVPGTAPGGHREGCSTCTPFLIDGTNVLELPTTIPEDYLLDLAGFTPDESLAIQIEAMQNIKLRGGIANVLTHPEPLLSARPPWRDIYRLLIDRQAAENDVWLARPCDVDCHWRSRMARIEKLWSRSTRSALWRVPPELPLRSEVAV